MRVDPARATTAVLPDRDLDSFCRDQHARVLGMLSLYCADRDLAEELTQEALARLCIHWVRLPSTEDAERWLTRVAFNLAKSSFRSKATRRRVLDRHGHALAPGPISGDAASAIAVRSAVAALPERERRALILRYFADLPVAEVASRMSCPEGTVKTLTFQAIGRLRRAGLEVSDD